MYSWCVFNAFSWPLNRVTEWFCKIFTWSLVFFIKAHTAADNRGAVLPCLRLCFLYGFQCICVHRDCGIRLHSIHPADRGVWTVRVGQQNEPSGDISQHFTIPVTGVHLFHPGAGIFKQSMGARNRVGIGYTYWPARLHRLAEIDYKRLKIRAPDPLSYIGWRNQFLGIDSWAP